jgi:hypothetical protein
MIVANNVSATSSNNVPHTIKAAIIDDAFDNIIVGEIPMDELREFHQIVDANSDLLSLLKRLRIRRPDLDELSDDDPIYIKYLNQLWRAKDKDATLHQMLTQGIFSTRYENSTALENICRNIEGCNIEVIRYGSSFNYKKFKKGDYDFIFIDYYLGVTGTPEAEKKAKGLAKEIYAACPKNKKPVTILMSSHPNVKELKSSFRSQANILEVGFIFYSKSDLSDDDTISLRIKALKTSLSYIHNIQKYLGALSNAADEALKKFQEEIKSLSIEDYAFIQYSKLKEDRHPLGDYMSWLYGSRWGSLLFNHEQFRLQQKKIDALNIPDPIWMQEMPSEHVAKIYASALFDEHLEDIKTHPLNNDNSTSPGVKKFHLHLGDILSAINSSTVYMVSNPQCDLEREVPLTRSIILIPGELVLLTQSTLPNSHSQTKTNFFNLDEKSYRILWKVKDVITIPYGKMPYWKQKHKLKRQHRLKLPFALEIQQVFSSSLTRIGNPVSPPLREPVCVEVLVRSKDGLPSVFLEKINNVAFFTHIRDEKGEKHKIILTIEFAILFKNKIKEYLQKLKVELNDLQQSTASKREQDKQEAKIKQFTNFLSGFDDWFHKKNYMEKPNKLQILENNIVSIMMNAPKDKFEATTIFLINISSNEENT